MEIYAFEDDDNVLLLKFFITNYKLLWIIIIEIINILK